MGEVARISQNKLLELEDARIAKVAVKTNSLGVSVAKIEVEVESDNPDADFNGILGLQRQYVSVRIDGHGIRSAGDE